MSISRKADRENHPLFDFRDTAATLTRARAEQIVTAIVGWNPKAADELANLLLKLEQAVAACNDDRVDAVIDVIDLLVEMAFQESEAYCEYLNEYRESVNQLCRRAFGESAARSDGRSLGEACEPDALIFMIARSRRRWTVQ
jgi:hypothetical protein